MSTPCARIPGGGNAGPLTINAKERSEKTTIEDKQLHGDPSIALGNNTADSKILRSLEITRCLHSID